MVSNDNPALFAVAPSVSAAGVLSFMPAPAQVGSALVGVRLVDDGGTARGGVDASAVAVFRISVANGAPVAGDDGPLVTDEDQPLVVAGAVLLANDSDPDGQPLVVVSADAASHAGGTVTGGVGSFTYTPPADWSGTDWFDYTVGDGTATDTAHGHSHRAAGE